MLLNAAKCQGYSFYRLWVIKGKPTGGGGGGGVKLPPTEIRVKKGKWFECKRSFLPCNVIPCLPKYWIH